MRYHNITKDDMLNGEGLRVALWVAGCNHCCKGCQNPSTWDPNGGIEFDKLAKNEIWEQLEKDYISGITFTGGDPMHPLNREEILKLATEIKNSFPDKNIWLYTGYEWDDIKKDPIMFNIAKLTDVIVDGKFVEDLKDTNLHWKGSSNQHVINVPETLKKENIQLKFNNSYETITDSNQFKPCGCESMADKEDCLER